MSGNLSSADREAQKLANMRESMGVGVAPTPGMPVTAPGIPARLLGVAKNRNALEIPLHKIVRDPGQPREEFDVEALERLAESIRSKGQLQPVRVRWDEGQGAYVVVCGERRWRAAKMAGLETLSCVVDERALSPNELLGLQLVENAVREDLRPVEQAKAYRTLMDANRWSARELASQLQLHHSGVVRALSLLNLPGDVQADVESGRLSPSSAYEVAKADPSERSALASRVVAEGITVGQLRAGRPAASIDPAAKRVWKFDGVKLTVEAPASVGDQAVAAAVRKVLRELTKAKAADAA